MATLSTHYKERTPEETVKIIKDFFNSHGYDIKEIDFNQSEASTWYGHVDLYLDNIYIDGSNGKGVNESYCRASGYAELYERFCNGMMFGANPYYNRLLTEKNYMEHGYYLRPEEKILSYDELSQCCFRMMDFNSYFMHNDPQLIKASYDFMTGGQYIGLPMKNINDQNDVLYMDPRILLRITHSIGMAAGNTITEALNQGISELVEKEAEQKLFNNWNDTHYALNLDKIENPTLKHIITEIQKLGYQLYLFDLSYSYDVPTMMSLLIDKENNVLNINFGAFPVFDIAAERVLTELYQGVNSYKGFNYAGRIQTPYKNLSLRQLYSVYCNSISGEVFPAEFFDHIEMKDHYNQEVFLDTTTDNETILKYFYDLGLKHGQKFYYLDNSLCPEVAAVHIICEGMDMYTNNQMYTINWDKISIQRAITTMDTYQKVYDGIYNNKLDYTNLIQVITEENFQTTNDFFGNIRLWNDFLLSENNGAQLSNLLIFITNDLQGRMIFQNVNNIPFDVYRTVVQKSFKKYLTLRTYLLSQAYSVEELKHIFNEIFNFNITDEDIDNCNNTVFMLKKAYVEPLHEYITNGWLDKVVNTYRK